MRFYKGAMWVCTPSIRLYKYSRSLGNLEGTLALVSIHPQTAVGTQPTLALLPSKFPKSQIFFFIPSQLSVN